jgi:hypothetical protein
VRAALLDALVGLTPRRWQPAHLDALGEIIEQALDASDLSAATTLHAERLLVGLLPGATGWARRSGRCRWTSSSRC